MTITSSGSPPWARTNDFTTYGGHSEKQNSLGRGAIDPLRKLSQDDAGRLQAARAIFDHAFSFVEQVMSAPETDPIVSRILARWIETGRLPTKRRRSPIGRLVGYDRGAM